MAAQRIIGIAGGIGCGKSVVCNIVRANGHNVYDCDSRAKLLMASDPCLLEIIRRVCGENAVNTDGSLNTQAMADVIFTDSEARLQINRAVHAAVRQDILATARRIDARQPLFIESAILASSGLAQICTEIWKVDAPRAIRIRRLEEQRGISRQDTEKRMEAQEGEDALLQKIPHRTIRNYEPHPLIAQTEYLLNNPN